MKLSSIRTEADFDAGFQSEKWRDAAREICRRERVSDGAPIRAGGSEHIVFTIAEKFVLKIYRPFRNCFERETRALAFVAGKTDFVIPEIVATGEFEGFRYVLMTQVAGVSMTRAEWLGVPEKAQFGFIAELAAGLRRIHALGAQDFENDWARFVENRAATFIERQRAHGVNAKVLDALPAYIEENLKLVPVATDGVFMHADVHFGNLRVLNSNGKLRIGGLFDFADSRVGFHEYDFLAVGVLMMQGQRAVQREFFTAYGYAEKDLDETLRRRLMMLTMLYETADLRRYAMRLKPEAVGFSLAELERGIWSFAD